MANECKGECWAGWISRTVRAATLHTSHRWCPWAQAHAHGARKKVVSPGGRRGKGSIQSGAASAGATETPPESRGAGHAERGAPRHAGRALPGRHRLCYKTAPPPRHPTTTTRHHRHNETPPMMGASAQVQKERDPPRVEELVALARRRSWACRLPRIRRALGRRPVVTLHPASCRAPHAQLERQSQRPAVLQPTRRQDFAGLLTLPRALCENDRLKVPQPSAFE